MSTDVIRLIAPFLLFTTLSADSAEAPKEIERIVTTASRAEAQASAFPYLISDIDEAVLNMTAPAHIEEVLRFIAGVGVQRGNGQEYLPAIRSQVFTGAGACGGLLTAEDGIPLRAAGFCNINELFEAHSEMAQRIEVLKGPGSALYGSNAVHGVINVVTPDTTRGGGLATLDYGSFGYNRVKLRQGVDWGQSGLGVNLSLTRDTGYRNEEGFDQQKVNVRHRYESQQWTLTSGLTVTNLDQETAGYITGFEAYKDKQKAKSNENPDAFRKAQSLRFWSSLNISLDENETLILTPYVRDQSMDFRMHFLPGTPMEENAQHGAGLQSLYTLQLDSQWQLKAGLDAEYTRGTLQQYQDGPTPGSAFLTETIPEGDHYDYDVDATLLAPFAELTWQSGDWLLSMGARFESMQYDYTNNMVSGRTRDDGSTCGFGGCRYARPESREDNFDNLSPKLGLTYQLNPDVQLYANLSAGYRAPQATELYRLQREQTVADLDTETALNTEIGVRGSAEDMSYVVSVYQMDKDNVIFRDSDFFNVNGGETRHQGIEVELQQQLSTAFDVALAATYARHTYRHDELLNDINIKGNDIDSAPRTQANARLGWNATQDTRIVLEWQHIGEYFTDPENLHEYEGHDVFHLRGSHNITPSLTVYARIMNLADTRYAERADFTSFGGDRYFPGRPRHGMVSVTYQW